jgi:DUF1365 family protein
MGQPGPPTESAIRSCLYECRVMHQRLKPARNRFEHGVFLLCLDLDELDSLGRSLRLFGRNRRKLYEFRDSDHLRFPTPGTAGDVKTSLRAWLAAQGQGLPEDARVTLVTLTRVAGYIFNPVSFFFCQTATGEPLCAVAEVCNTFGELKPYLVPVDRTSTAAGAVSFRVVVTKRYYVSPFSALDLSFDFRLRLPGERLEIAVNDVLGDETHLVSTLAGDRRPLTDRQLLRLTLRYPLVTLRVIVLIHWHALRLWWKGLPWHRKTDRRDLQRDVFRPHASLRMEPEDAKDARG